MAAVMAILRGGSGLSQLEFAHLLGCQQALVSKIERGQRQTFYDIREILRLWDVLELPRQGLLPLITGEQEAMVNTDDESGFWGDPEYTRREFSALVGAAAAGAALPQTGLPMRVDKGHVRFLESSLERLGRQDRVIGGTGLFRQGERLLRRARAMLDECDYDDQVGARLLGVTADLGIETAWLAYDAGRQDPARALYADAAMLAQSSGDPQLQAHVNLNMAQQATYLARATGRRGHAREALRFAERAGMAARHLPSPRLRALIELRRALAHAELGDEIAFRREVALARDEIERGSHDSDQNWTSFVRPSEINGYEASGYCSLDRRDRATPLFRVVLEDDRSPRDRAFYRARLAGSLAELGDVPGAVEEGMAVLAEIVDGHLTSGRVLRELRPVRQAATGGSDEFRDRFDQAESMLAGA
ncbi:helix-turn-helix transcriptional regulator [Spirillospora sp. NPDC052269]